MNKQTECLKTILSVSSILNVLAPLAKKIALYKKANKQNQFKQNPPSKEKDLILAYYNLFLAEDMAISLWRQ